MKFLTILKIFNHLKKKKVFKADEEYRLKQARLPFVKKLAILEEMQERTHILRKAKEVRDKKS